MTFWKSRAGEHIKRFSVSVAGVLGVLVLTSLYTFLMNGPLWFVGLAALIVGTMCLFKLVLDVIFK